MHELLIAEKKYISSKRASELTGYAKDYVGQLCREGYVEATMVGRSWYVLESSILEHRFGQIAPEFEKKSIENIIPALQENDKAPESPIATWQAAKYIPEANVVMPDLISVTKEEEVVPIPSQVTLHGTAETLSDMQEAWQEWFARKQQPLLETEEVLQQRENDSRAEMPLNTSSNLPAGAPIVSFPAQADEVLEIEEEAQSIPIHKLDKTIESLSDLADVDRQEHRRAHMKRPIETESTLIIKESERHIPPAKEKKSISASIASILLILLMIGSALVTVIGTGIFSDKIRTQNIIIQYLEGTR